MERKEPQTALERTGAGVQPLAVTPEYIERTKTSLSLLREMVREVLVRGRDYGRVPGIPSDFLWDPGASQIIASFNCHVGPRRFLSFVDDGQKIAVVIEVPLIHTASGTEVGSGIGASSTLETKHKYRWVDNPREWGFGEEAIKSMKSRPQDGRTVYRVLNPEHDELLNTVIRIASKRAEVDAAEGLPGAASALRELFSGKAGKAAGAPQAAAEVIDETSPRWTSFWGQTRALGLDPDKVHELLGVKSMKDWMKKGKSLDDAIRALSEKMVPQGKSRSAWDAVTQEQVPDYESLEAVVKELRGLSPEQIYIELGGGSRADMTMPVWDAFLTLKEAYAPEEEGE